MIYHIHNKKDILSLLIFLLTFDQKYKLQLVVYVLKFLKYDPIKFYTNFISEAIQLF